MKETENKKLCLRCGKEKDISLFYKNTAGISKLKIWCKDCVRRSGYWREHYKKYAEHQKERKRLYYKANPEMFKVARKKYYRKNRKKILAQQSAEYYQNPDLKLRKSLATARISKLNCSCSLDELCDWYNRQFAKQKGCCAICGRHESEFKTRFHIDHDHETGKLRALLCSGCNTGIGGLQDDAELCIKAYDYLRTY